MSNSRKPGGKVSHGHSFRGRRTKEYLTWLHIKARTQNPNCDAWERYGGRGITLFPEWITSFDAFISHIGPAPSEKHTVDRIDNEGNYEPGNVRWATNIEQQRNTSRNVLTEEKVVRLLYLKRAGASPNQIAEIINSTLSAVRAVLYGRTWKTVKIPE